MYIYIHMYRYIYVCEVESFVFVKFFMFVRSQTCQKLFSLCVFVFILRLFCGFVFGDFHFFYIFFQMNSAISS